jgi:hypothetical protein
MKKINDLLLDLGLTKVQNSYFVLSTKVQLFGEVIRLFESDNKVVFFAQLVEKRCVISNDNILKMPYTHLFTYGLDTIPDKFEQFKHANNFILEGTQEELDFLEWLVKNAIRQKKELELNYELDKIEKDF